MHGGVSVGQKFFASVTLREYLAALTDAFTAYESGTWQRPAPVMAAAPAGAALEPQALTYDAFFDALNDWVKGSDGFALVADAGFPLIGAQNVHVAAQSGFVAQASWLAIGYSTAASIGVKCAMPDKRVVVTVGDGAFQETCQAVSSHAHLKQNTVVFVIANGIYGIEQKIVNPNPFREHPVHYRDELLNGVFSYNVLHPWAYEKLAGVVGGVGRSVSNAGELRAVFAEVDACPDANFIVRVVVPRTDTPRGMKNGLKEVGDDETENPAWPPELFF
jgi:indolepyruvate decarboxylase